MINDYELSSNEDDENFMDKKNNDNMDFESDNNNKDDYYPGADDAMKGLFQKKIKRGSN